MKAIICSLLSVSAFSLHAATVTVNYTAGVSASGTAYDGLTATGVITYDDAFINAGSTPSEIFSPNASITVSIFGESFTEMDDLESGTFPVVTFLPAQSVGEVDQISIFLMFAEGGGSNPVAIAAPGVSVIELELGPADASLTDIVGTATVTAVPEPGSALLLLCGFFPLLRRRR